MERLINHFVSVIKSENFKILNHYDNVIRYMEDDIIYVCEHYRSNTVILKAIIGTAYNIVQNNDAELKMDVFELLNSLNSSATPCTYFLEYAYLRIRKYYTMPESVNASDFASFALHEFSCRFVAGAIKALMEDEKLACKLGNLIYPRYNPPITRIANSGLWTKFSGQYSEGMVDVADKQGLYGFLDADTRFAIPCRWTDAQRFSEGLAAVADERGCYGFIDRKGRVVIPCEWHNARIFSEGLAAVMNARGSWGFIDRYARLVIPCKWDDVLGCFENGKVFVRDAMHRPFTIDRRGNVISTD